MGYKPVVPASQETEVGESWIKANLGKKISVKPYLNNKQTKSNWTSCDLSVRVIA
jgi:hypothetical protein